MARRLNVFESDAEVLQHINIEVCDLLKNNFFNWKKQLFFEISNNGLVKYCNSRPNFNGEVNPLNMCSILQ